MVEALARLSLTNGDVLSPAVFLPLLEQDELHLLFQQGLDQALRALQEWETQGISVSLSINVAPSTLIHPDFSEWITQALTRYQVLPARLTLEVLETEAYDQETFYTAIHTLNRLGVALSMDDLGSGYSSLERLSSRYFDLIKIDQSLLFRIRQDPLAILSLIDLLVQLGESLALDVVVEGVEAPDVLEAMMMLNTKFVQGYQLARPMPLTQLPAWLSEFQLPVRNGEIHTYLGALAYHLTSFKKRGMRSKTTLANCPLTRFLDEQGLASSDPANWHAQIHAGQDIHLFSQQLVEWLAEQVRAGH
jgi:EAL domain-containing protein (putative c-di-GMP-specific phosphodiesterase class I)